MSAATHCGAHGDRECCGRGERLRPRDLPGRLIAGVHTEDAQPGRRAEVDRTFDDAEARNAGNPAYVPYPAGAPRHPGLVAKAVLAERAATREAVASTMAKPGTDPESGEVTRIIELLRAEDKPEPIAGDTGVLPPAHSGLPED